MHVKKKMFCIKIDDWKALSVGGNTISGDLSINCYNLVYKSRDIGWKIWWFIFKIFGA